jgi:hypothetical protein
LRWVLGEERGVEAQRLLGGERVLGDGGEGAVLADERPGAGGKVQVARAETRGGLEQLRRKRSRRPAGRPRRPDFPGWRTGRWRADRRGLAHGLTGEFLQHLDVVDDAAIDQELGELQQVGLGAEGTKNGLALRAGKKSLVDA